MTILYFDPTKCEEPKPVDYKYSDIPKVVEKVVECECGEVKLSATT